MVGEGVREAFEWILVRERGSDTTLTTAEITEYDGVGKGTRRHRNNGGKRGVGQVGGGLRQRTLAKTVVEDVIDWMNVHERWQECTETKTATSECGCERRQVRVWGGDNATAGTVQITA